MRLSIPLAESNAEINGSPAPSHGLAWYGGAIARTQSPLGREHDAAAIARSYRQQLSSARMERPARIPPARYTSREFMELEWEHVWTRTWLLAGRSTDIPAAGDYFLYEIGRESIVVVRDASGAIRAHYNVCQHRGSQLVQAPRGHLECFRCPYHGWEYQLDGRVRRITDASAFLRGHASDIALSSVRCEEWQGFVFVNMDEAAAPLSDSLGSLAPALAPYELGTHALIRDLTVEWECNWKVCMDNSNETYHIQSVHPQLLDMVDDVDTPPEMHGDHSCFTVHMGVPSGRRGPSDGLPGELARYLGKFGLEERNLTVAEVPAAIRAALRARLRREGIDYPALTDAQLADNYHVHLFPNVMFNIMLPGFWLFRVRPHASDPERMYFNFQEYERIGDGRPIPPRPTHTHHVGSVAIDTVLDQDAAIMSVVQRGLRSRGCPPLRFGAQEARLLHMHEVLERYVYGAAGSGR